MKASSFRLTDSEPPGQLCLTSGELCVQLRKLGARPRN
jgi:hypothetical protein